MVHQWSTLPTLLGMPLQQGVMWVAEINGLIGFGFFLDSNIKLGIGRSSSSYSYTYGYSQDGYRSSVNKYYYGDDTVLLYILPLIIGFFQLLFSIMLGVGAAKRIDCLVFPWIVFFTIQTTLIALAAISWAIASIFVVYLSAPISIFTFISTVIYVEIMRYAILGVISFRRSIRYEKLTPTGNQLPNIQDQQWVPQPNGQPPQLVPQLSTVPGYQLVQQPAISQISAPQLSTVAGYQWAQQPVNSQISAPQLSTVPGYQWVLQPANSQFSAHPANGMQSQSGPQSSTMLTGPNGVSLNSQQNSEQGIENKEDDTLPLVHV